MYLCSPALSQISLKNSFGKVVFQILAKIEMTRNKNLLFGRFVIFYSPYIYGANLIAKFCWKSGFLRLGP